MNATASIPENGKKPTKKKTTDVQTVVRMMITVCTFCNYVPLFPVSASVQSTCDGGSDGSNCTA